MQKSISIAGYIRKLPDGQKASEDKIALATSLGLSLADDETYVEPLYPPTNPTTSHKAKNVVK